MTERTISIPEALFDQAQRLAQALDISEGQLFAIAIERFVSHFPPLPPAQEGAKTPPHAAGESSPGDRTPRRIDQGDIYWVQLQDMGAGPTAIPHPYVVIQDNLFNHSRIESVVVCALTTNIRRNGETPGNILLDVGEANLPKQSVVEVSKISTVNKAQLGDYIGTLSELRIAQILAGIRFLQLTFFSR